MEDDFNIRDDVLIPPIFHILEHNNEQNRTHNLYCDILGKYCIYGGKGGLNVW